MIKYRKAREIIDQVADDLSSYDDQGLIDYSRLFKVLRKCNEFLGHRINPEKQEVIRIQNFKGILPEDFSSLNFAFVCTEKLVNVTPPKGFQVEYKTVCKGKKSCSPCLTDCDNDFVIYQYLDDDWIQFKSLEPLQISSKSFNKCTTDCPNVFVTCDKVIEVNPDNTVTATFEKGYVYLNYVGTMEDEDEDLLIIDHPLVEPYYEGELTRTILKSIVYNKDGAVAELYQDAKIEAARAKIDAMHFTAMPGYDEIRDLYQSQRVRLYKKYFLPILGY